MTDLLVFVHLIKTVMQLFSGGVGGLSVTTPLPIVNLDVVVGGESGGITSDVCPATCGDCLSDAVDSCLSCRTGYKRIGSAPFPTACVGTYDPTKGLRMQVATPTKVFGTWRPHTCATPPSRVTRCRARAVHCQRCRRRLECRRHVQGLRHPCPGHDGGGDQRRHQRRGRHGMWRGQGHTCSTCGDVPCCMCYESGAIRSWGLWSWLCRFMPLPTSATPCNSAACAPPVAPSPPSRPSRLPFAVRASWCQELGAAIRWLPHSLLLCAC